MYSIIKEKYFKPTNKTLIHNPLPFNIEFNNGSNFTAYYVGFHAVLLALEDFSTYRAVSKKLKKVDPRNC
jgi:hypothetical protein